MHCKFCDLEVNLVCSAGNRTMCKFFKKKFDKFKSSKPATLEDNKEDQFTIPLKTAEQLIKEEKEREEIADGFVEFFKETRKVRLKKCRFADE